MPTLAYKPNTLEKVNSILSVITHVILISSRHHLKPQSAKHCIKIRRVGNYMYKCKNASYMHRREPLQIRYGADKHARQGSLGKVHC